MRCRKPPLRANSGVLGLLLAAISTPACGPPMVDEPIPVGGAASPSETGSAGACAGGAVHDDGSVETGYGFVPSATFGEYVQALAAESLPSRNLSKVCICWLKTRGEHEIAFEVIFYPDADGRPADQAYASIPATAEGIPVSVADAGRFYEVDVSGVRLPPGRSYVGARWDPSQAGFLFICTDTSEETERTDVFFREDRAPRWTRTTESRDPIFLPHRAILVRAQAVDIP